MNLKEILKKYEAGNKKNEDKQVPFFTLKKDGESATVRFLVKDVDDLGKYVFETHKVKIGDYDNFVKCTGNDCVCCRETRTSLRMFVPVFNLKTNQVGGTGLTHDWNKSNEMVKKLNKPTFLAGGLNPDNVKEAIKTAEPYGVDVNSGCKNEFGKKDAKKVQLFVSNAKGM